MKSKRFSTFTISTIEEVVAGLVVEMLVCLNIRKCRPCYAMQCYAYMECLIVVFVLAKDTAVTAETMVWQKRPQSL